MAMLSRTKRLLSPSTEPRKRFMTTASSSRSNISSPISTLIADALRKVLLNNYSHLNYFSEEKLQSIDSQVSTSNFKSNEQVAADYQINIAGMLSKMEKKSPKEVAIQLIDFLQPHLREYDMTLTLSGKSFINIKLQDRWIYRRVLSVPFADLRTSQKEKILVDFSSPNMGKELHVGHIRSALIGDTLSRILEEQGHDVERVSHVGDSGLPVAYILNEDEYQHQVLGEPLRFSTNPEGQQFISPTLLSALYAQAKKHSEDPAFESSSQSLLMEIQSALSNPPSDVKPLSPSHDGSLGTGYSVNRKPLLGPPGAQLLETWRKTYLKSKNDVDANSSRNRELYLRWQALCASSRAGFAPLLHRLGVQVVERGESAYAPLLQPLVNELQEKGVAVESTGSLAAFVDGPDKSPLIVQRSRGGFLYATVDLACLRVRLLGGFNRIVYVTDVAQSHHFRQVFKVAEAAGWVNSGKNMLLGDKEHAPILSLVHAPFGLVTGPGGKKLASRDGTELTMASLFRIGDEMCMKALFSEKNRDSDESSSSPEGENTQVEDRKDRVIQSEAAALCSASVRAFDLLHRRTSDYVFDYDRVLDLKGRTALYILYAVARLSQMRYRLSSLLLELQGPGTAGPLLAAFQLDQLLSLVVSRQSTIREPGFLDDVLRITELTTHEPVCESASRALRAVLLRVDEESMDALQIDSFLRYEADSAATALWDACAASCAARADKMLADSPLCSAPKAQVASSSLPLTGIFHSSASVISQALGNQFTSSNDGFVGLVAEERALIVAALRFPEALQSAAKTLQPHQLLEYLHSMATLINAAYETCRVLPAYSKEDLRHVNAKAWQVSLQRTRSFASVDAVMRRGLRIAGIPVLSKI